VAQIATSEDPTVPAADVLTVHFDIKRFSLPGFSYKGTETITKMFQAKQIPNESMGTPTLKSAEVFNTLG